MKKNTDELLAWIQEGKLEPAYHTCYEWIDSCEEAFIQHLNSDTATDLVAMAVLYCQIAAAEKKPWKAVPVLERIRGALRFMNDFTVDRGVVASAFFTVGEGYAYANFFPEAAEAFSQSAKNAQDSDLFTEALYRSMYYTRCSGKDWESGTMNSSFLTQEQFLLLVSEVDSAIKQRILLDPVENTPAYLEIRFLLEQKIDEELVRKFPSQPFHCLEYWKIKQEILKNEYGIIWKSPEVMNPHIRFC